MGADDREVAVTLESNAEDTRIDYNMNDLWTCDYCSSQNDGNDHCPNCGARRDNVESREPTTSDNWKQTPDLFLIHPKNKKFIAGKRKRPASQLGGCVLLIALPFVTFAIFSVAWTIRDWNNYNILESSGVAARAQYTDRRIKRDAEYGDDYYVTYSFEYQGVFYSAKQHVSRDEYMRAEMGSSVDIVFSPDNPNLSEFSHSLEPPVSTTQFVIGWNVVVWIGVGLLILRIRKSAYMARKGTIIEGAVFGRRGYIDGDNDFNVEIIYEFMSPQSGNRIKKKQKQMRNDLTEHDLPAKGAPVAVLYVDDKRFVLL